VVQSSFLHVFYKIIDAADGVRPQLAFAASARPELAGAVNMTMVFDHFLRAKLSLAVAAYSTALG
jgi:hypothetical protein